VNNVTTKKKTTKYWQDYLKKKSNWVLYERIISRVLSHWVWPRKIMCDNKQTNSHTHSLSLSLSHTHTHKHTHFNFWTFAHKLLSRVHDRRERERERLIACVCVCMWERETNSVCVCVYVCVREREFTVHIPRGADVWAIVCEQTQLNEKMGATKDFSKGGYLPDLPYNFGIKSYLVLFFSVVSTIDSLWQHKNIW